MDNDLEQTRTLFTLNNVPVKARRSFWLLPPLLWGLLAWIAGKRQPQRSLWRRLLVGGLATPLAMSADAGHVLAHTVSARLAGAPMDAILLGADMPRTLYRNNQVPPRVHILRSLGGPLANFLGLFVALLWRQSARPRSTSRELAETTAVGHGALAFGSLLPIPIVDGGVILRWLLVLRGNPPAQAGQMVNKISIALGATAVGVGALLALLGRRVWGMLTAAGGLLAAAAGAEWLR